MARPQYSLPLDFGLRGRVDRRSRESFVERVDAVMEPRLLVVIIKNEKL